MTKEQDRARKAYEIAMRNKAIREYPELAELFNLFPDAEIVKIKNPSPRGDQGRG